MKSDILTIDNTQEINKQKIIESIGFWVQKIKSQDSMEKKVEEETKIECEIMSSWDLVVCNYFLFFSIQ